MQDAQEGLLEIYLRSIAYREAVLLLQDKCM